LKNQFWDRRFRLNVAGFYYDYNDIQLRSLVPPNPVPLLYNAAKSKIKGADVDLELAVTSNLRLTAGVEYLNAKYDSFPDGSCAVPAPTGGNPTSVLCNLDGRTMIRSPKFTSNVGVQYTMPLPGGTSLRLSANDNYNSGFFWEPDNRLRQRPYNLVSAAARFSFQDDHYALELWGKNLANEVIFTNAASASSDTYAIGQPRTFGITGSMKF
jgi:iron complex outermembrane recepter protein